MFLRIGEIYTGQKLLSLGAKLYSDDSMKRKEWRIRFGRTTYVVWEVEEDKYRISKTIFEFNGVREGDKKWQR